MAKNYSHQIALGRRRYNGNAKAIITRIEVVTCVYGHPVLEQFWPIDFKAGRRAVFFVGAAHFVLAPFRGMLWCFARLFIPAPAGWQRFNVLGALNALTPEGVTVTNATYLNAESVCELFVDWLRFHSLCRSR